MYLGIVLFDQVYLGHKDTIRGIVITGIKKTK